MGRVLSTANNLKRNQLLALPAAVALAYAKLYAIDADASTSKTIGQDLNAIGDIIMTMVELYTFSPTGGEVRKLSANEVNGGTFANRARELNFPDGRPTLTRLAVRTDEFNKALEYLQASKTPRAAPR
jgi:hypothetical protein